VRGAAAVLSEAADVSRRLEALKETPRLVQTAADGGKLHLVTKELKGGRPAPMVAALLSNLDHPNDDIAYASTECISKLCEEYVDGVHELAVAALSAMLHPSQEARSTRVLTAFAGLSINIGGVRFGAKPLAKLLGHIIYIAANGADGETGYPPVSREAAGLALAAFFLRPDAAAVARMLPTGLHMHMRDAVLTLLNGKLARIQDAGIRCFIALDKMGGELGEYLKHEIVGAVSPPIVKKLTEAVATVAIEAGADADATVNADADTAAADNE